VVFDVLRRKVSGREESEGDEQIQDETNDHGGTVGRAGVEKSGRVRTRPFFVESVVGNMDRKERERARIQRRRGVAAQLNARMQEERKTMNLRGDGKRIGMERDPIEVPGQKFAVFSYVAPHTAPQRCKTVAIKIRGCFETKDAADQRAHEVSQMDPDFDVFVVEMYEWLVVPMPLEQQASLQMKYNEKKMQQLMDSHYETVEKGRKTVQGRMQHSVEEGRKAAAEHRRAHGIAGAPMSREVPITEEVHHPESVREISRNAPAQ